MCIGLLLNAYRHNSIKFDTKVLEIIIYITDIYLILDTALIFY